MGKRFYLRKAKLDDINIVYELRNDELVRHNSINQDKISFDTHKDWFLKTINDENVKFYLAFSDSDEFIGQVRFAKQENFFWEVSMSIVAKYRRGGYSLDILYSAIDLSGLENFLAYIFSDNIASLKIFQKAGFYFSKENKINQRTIVVYHKKKCKNGNIENIDNNGQKQLDGAL